MRKFFTVFKFEFLRHVKSKPFVILTLLVAIALMGVLSYPAIKESFTSTEAEDVEPQKGDAKIIGIDNDSTYDDADLLAMFKMALEDYEIKAVAETAKSAIALVEEGEYNMILILDDVGEYTLITQPTGINSSITYQIDAILLNYYKTHLLTESGLSATEATVILSTLMDSEIIETGKNQSSTFFYTYILVILLYMTIIIYGQLVSTSVASEKSSRAMEVLITTIKPVKMMFGKVLGTGCAALLQLLVIIGSGVFFYNINAEYWGMNELIKSIFDMPMDTMLISVILFVLGFFVYAFIYAAVGSLANHVEDINTSTLPITFVSIGSFMIVMFSMASGNVDSTFMKLCSWFPLTSPFALLVRSSMSDVSLLESAGAVGILLVTAVVIGYIAALIYKMGVLLYGKPPKISEVFKLIKKPR